MARAIWTGSISFGLVTIPVRVFSAVHEHDVRFHQVAPDGSRIRYQRVSEKTGKVVDYDDIKKGVETSKGKWVVLDPDELDALTPATTKTIDIEDFVSLEEIDPVFFDRTYHLAPRDEPSTRAYALLASAMEHRNQVGIGRVVMREKQYLAAIRPFEKGLAMSTMVFADEIVPQSEIDRIPTRRPTVGTRERQMAEQIIESLSRKWDPKRYRDTYEEQVRALVRARAKGKTIDVEEREEEPPVHDLMEALRASLERGTRRTRAHSNGRVRKRSHTLTTSRGRKATRARKTA